MKRFWSMLIFVFGLILQLAAAEIELSTTLPENGRPEHLYTMVNGNGVYADGQTAPVVGDAEHGLFAFYASEKENAYYIYSYTGRKWVTYTLAASYSNGKNFVKMSDSKVDGAYFKFSGSTGGTYELQPYTTAGTNDKFLNWFQGADANKGLPLGLWQENGATDAGSRYTFTEVEFHSYNYTLHLPDGVSVTIGGNTYADGDTYACEGSLSRADMTIPAAPAGQFLAVSINDATETVTVSYVNTPVQPATETYVRDVIYPLENPFVGEARLTDDGNVFTLSNKVLAASYVKVNGALYFGGSSALDLLPGTEPFTMAFGSGTTVPASGMTLKSLTATDLAADPDAVGGAEHFAGKALVAEYEYTYKDTPVSIVWKAVLRDGSHYLRTEMEITGSDDVDMYNVIPMIYDVDTKTAGSVPAVVGNTRGAVLMSNKIFAGLENPVAYNTVGTAGEENVWEQTSTSSYNLTAASWQTVAESEVPARVTEATGASAPNVLAYTVSGVELSSGQKLEGLVKYTAGNHRLNLGGMDLLDEAGSIVASDYKSGFTGGQAQNNTFSLRAPSDGTFSVRFFVENKTESIDASSTVTLTVSTLKEGATVRTDIVTMQGRWSRNATLKQGDNWKISSVVGLIAQDGNQAEENIHKTQKRRSFLAYSERERAVPWRAFPAYISWYELNIDRNNAADPTKNMNADQVLDVESHWKSALHDRYGIGPRSFVIDDGWDNYGTWTFHSGFPNEMRDIAASASEMGAGVGAWLGPVGGYGTSGNYRRSYWTSKGQSMVLSNPEYYAVFKAAAQNLTQNNGDFNFFKFDGISAQFSATGPDPGDTGNENAEGIIRLERYVREELKRDIFFNTTVGTWASPFWYHYTDATWRQEGDFGTIGNNSNTREKWITYRDNLVHQNYVTASPVCPINTLMTHGFILTTHGNVTDNFDYQSCLRELRCAFVCGSGMVELYNDYALMNSINKGQLWADLAECISWQKRNADVLPDAHWVGGDPWTGNAHQVYGWAAWNGPKATLALRNGDNKAQSYTFTLREALNIPAFVNGSITLRKSFGVQDALQGLTEGEAIDIDTQLTVTLPGSSVFSFDGLATGTPFTAVNGITLTAENAEATVQEGKTLVVKAAVAPAEASFPALVWSTDNAGVATVNSGLVQGVAPGQATITATATDGSGVTATILVTVTDSEPVVKEDYALNFDKDASATRTDRYITDITFTAADGEAQTVSVNRAKPYVDETATELACAPGDEIAVQIGYNGFWMHGYVFVDVDNDKQFSFNEGSLDQSGTDVMSFSFYSGDFNNDASGVNSAGTELTGDARNTMVTPSFTAPVEVGTYRIRFKLDWNSVDPGGQLAADGTPTGGNGILANGGMIVDATLNVTDKTGIGAVEAAPASAPKALYDLSGRRLQKVPAHGVFIQDGRKIVK